MGYKVKLRADIFEAWIGGHVYERMQYDDQDPLHELRYFFHRLWSIRYRKLKQYRYDPTSNIAHIPSRSVEIPSISEIISHSDRELKKTLSSFLDAPNYKDQEIGHLVQIGCHTSFATSKPIANEMAALRVWTTPG
jgi:hypothetical protein